MTAAMTALRWFGDPDVAAAFTRWRSEGEACAIATVIATRSSAPRPVGSKLVICEDGKMAGSVSGGCVENAVALEARTVIASGDPILLHYGFTTDQAFEVGLPCGGEIDVFLEPGPVHDSLELDIASDATVLVTVLEGPQIGRKLLVRPGTGAVGGDDLPTLAEIAARVEHSGVLDWHGQKVFAEIFRPAPRLVIVGAIDIAEALASLASSTGWRTVCVDPRAAFATRERVPSAHELWIEWPDQALKTLDVDEETAVVVLLHDEKFIVPTLVSALAQQAFYVGVLGSRRAQSLWRSKLVVAGVAIEELARMHGPAGLDIGAATPTEVALSILAEILAVRSGRRGGFLRDGTGAIHPSAGESSFPGPFKRTSACIATQPD
jgi:xanthine dehydrogenase accessory factor